MRWEMGIGLSAANPLSAFLPGRSRCNLNRSEILAPTGAVANNQPVALLLEHVKGKDAARILCMPRKQNLTFPNLQAVRVWRHTKCLLQIRVVKAVEVSRQGGGSQVEQVRR